MLKGIAKLIVLVGFVAALFAVIQFIANYDVHKHPKEFFSNPIKYIKKVEKQKKEDFIKRLTEELKGEEPQQVPKVTTRLRTPIYIGVIIAVLAIIFLIFFKIFLDRPVKTPNMEDFYVDEIWDDDRHLYS
jgi:type II secretory pathway component PulC